MIAMPEGVAFTGNEDGPAIYLAGPMAQRPDEGQTWRQRIIPDLEDEFGILNPATPEDKTLSAAVSIQGDLEAIDQADVVFARLPPDVVTRGTAIEIWEAAVHRDTPVVVWTVREYGDARPSNAILDAAEGVFHDLGHATNLLRKLCDTETVITDA